MVQVWEVVEMKNLVMEMEGKNVEQLDLNNYLAPLSSSLWSSPTYLFAYYSFGRSWFSRGSILI